MTLLDKLVGDIPLIIPKELVDEIADDLNPTLEGVIDSHGVKAVCKGLSEMLRDITCDLGFRDEFNTAEEYQRVCAELMAASRSLAEMCPEPCTFEGFKESTLVNEITITTNQGRLDFTHNLDPYGDTCDLSELLDGELEWLCEVDGVAIGSKWTAKPEGLEFRGHLVHEVSAE